MEMILVIIKRFIERDYMCNIIKSISQYITNYEIQLELDKHQWSDLTFKFVPIGSGWKTVIIDNDTNETIAVDDLNPLAYDYYIKEVEKMSVNKAKIEMQKIRELLYA
jgi:hypothetical protein